MPVYLFTFYLDVCLTIYFLSRCLAMGEFEGEVDEDTEHQGDEDEDMDTAEYKSV